MPSLSGSPQRPAKTYSRKKKRIRDANPDMNASDSSEGEVEETSPKKAKGKKLSDMRPPEINSRQIDQARAPKPTSEDSTSKKHIRSSSSVSSLKQVQQDATITTSPSSSRKPPSVRAAKPVSSVIQNINPSESEMDDGASVADSVMTTTRVRRTEAERIAYFKNQPECDSLEPHRVKCLRCQKNINLGTKQTFAVRPWELHRAKCDQKVPSSVMLSQGASPSASVADEIAPSEGHTTGQARKSEAERKAFLLADPRAVEVKPDEVKCKQCQKWIRLSASQRYALYNWNAHQARCSDVVPSNKVVAASRKLKIVNDPQAKSYGPRHVDCASCGTTVQLQGEGDYNLACWEQHKTECSEAAAGPSQASASGETASISTTVRPPPSVESTSTLVVQDGQARGTKRRLEEDDLSPEDPDAHVDVRPRTETYVTPEKEPPSALGWFLMPIKSFIRGFKESLSHD